MIKLFDDSNSEVTYANDYTVRIKYDCAPTERVELGSPVLYAMSPDWWGYVGKVVATIAYNFTYELIIGYDTSVAGFANVPDACEYFDKIL